MPTIKARKQFGQHWLKDEKVLDLILEAASLSKVDRVLEIGTGTGILTRQLLPYVDSLLSVEIDRDLCKRLVKNFGDNPNFLLLEGDFLSLDVPTLVRDFPKFQNQNKVVANIPYNITGPILEKLLGKIAQPATTNYESIVLLVQKEVGERLVATPDSKTFGALSVRVQYLADCQLVCNVPAKSFSPPPKVDSVVVKLSPRSFANLANNPKKLDSLVKIGFANKRKMLRNNLKSIIELDRLDLILNKLDINPEIRAENLSVNDWVNLCNSLD